MVASRSFRIEEWFVFQERMSYESNNCNTKMSLFLYLPVKINKCDIYIYIYIAIGFQNVVLVHHYRQSILNNLNVLRIQTQNLL